MKAKWYFGTFLFIITLFVVNQQQFSIPNQEIVVQFSNDEVTLVEAENTITLLKNQLEAAGVEKIKVSKAENGAIKISYFSTIDVLSIKKIFTKEKDLELGISSLFNTEKSDNPTSNKNSSNYKLDIYEIDKVNELESGFNGLAVEFKSYNDQLFNHHVYFFKTEINVCTIINTEKVAYKIYRYLPVSKNNSLHIIPEVRAGPIKGKVS